MLTHLKTKQLFFYIIFQLVVVLNNLKTAQILITQLIYLIIWNMTPVKGKFWTQLNSSWHNLCVASTPAKGAMHRPWLRDQICKDISICARYFSISVLLGLKKKSFLCFTTLCQIDYHRANIIELDANLSHYRSECTELGV